MNRKHIPWFNPREMGDETVLALATGRSRLLAQLLQVIRQRSVQPGDNTHWLIIGPRGAGKSYFLRLLQASLQRAPIEKVRWVLLPEELPNIYAPHEFLLEIARMLDPSRQNLGQVAQWKVQDAGRLWDEALQQLLAQVPEGLLVVGVENFDELMDAAFQAEIDASRLRHLMSNQPRIMFVATSVLGDFDEKQEKRMFRQFEHRYLSPWNPQDHRDYLSARAKQQGTVSSAHQLNRIDAYSRYTGGNARAAAVLAATILDVDDLIVGAEDLDAAIEKMSDYYRAMIKRIPSNTMKLFDALIRGGEPASQTDIAERTGAKQSEISRAFVWLVDYGYVSESRETGQKAKQYRVLDRLLVQFYRMRYLQPGQRSRLAVMADLLADMLSFDEKWQVASNYANQELMPEAQTLVELALRERQIDIALLPIELQDLKTLIAKSSFLFKQDEVVYEVEGRKRNPLMQAVNAILERFPSEQSFIEALQYAEKLAAASLCQGVNGAEMVRVVKESPSMPPLFRYLLYSRFVGKQREFSASALDIVERLQKNQAELKLLTQSPAWLEQHQQLMEWQTQCPLSFSLFVLAGRKMQDDAGDDLASLPWYVVAGWLLSAAQSGMALHQPQYLSAVQESFIKAINLSLQQEYLPIAWKKLIDASADFDRGSKGQAGFAFQLTKGNVYFALGDFAGARAVFAESRACMLLDEELKCSIGPTYCLHQIAHCHTELGEVEVALQTYSQVIQECSASSELDASMPTHWAQLAQSAIGQIARLHIPQIGLAAALAEMDMAMQAFPDDYAIALMTVTQAILDKLRHEDHAAAFGLGGDILQELASRSLYPLEKVLRAFCLELLNGGADFDLIRDLLGEWPRLWPDNAGVHELRAVMLTWLDDLAQAPAEKEAKRKTLDPDLATTLAALEKALNPKTRFRLGLIEKN